MASHKIRLFSAWTFSIVVTIMLTKYYLNECVEDQPRSENERISQRSEAQQGTLEEVTIGQSVESQDIRTRNIFYNRVGKCGSRSLIQVVARLAKANHFALKSSTDTGHLHPDTVAVQTEATEIARLKPPTFYNKHIHFIDFVKYGYEKPIYINMIRNPIDRFVSHYNYHKYGDRANSKKILVPDRIDINECVRQEVELCNDTMLVFYTGMHFCGMHPSCLVKSKERVSLAKKHLDEEYTFVGMLEEFETTLLLLEKLLPEYFTGALQVWQQNKSSKIRTASKKRDFLTEESICKLRTNIMADEFEVYNFAKEKFDRLKEKFGLMK